MSVLKSRINGTARESVEDAAFGPDRTDGIESGIGDSGSVTERAKKAENYAAGKVDGVNVYTCQHGGQGRRHGRG